jgi:hypothetical protein
VSLVGRSPLLDAFHKRLVPDDVKRLAARGALGLDARDQLQVFVWLAGDPDPEISGLVDETIATLPRDGLAAWLASPDVSEEARTFFTSRGFSLGGTAAAPPGELVLDTAPDEVPAVPEAPASATAATGAMPEGGREADVRGAALAMLPVIDRVKLAMRGTREQRTVLIRDPNRIVASAVLSSPKLTDSEVEAFSRMANVSEEVLRVIGLNRQWTKSYPVVLGLARNPKTPLAVSMSLVPRLNARDMKALALDRNVPEGLRLAARKLLTTGQERQR